MTVILTKREQQILTLIVQGFTNREIAKHLSISESTTENHIHHIYAKLQVSNRAQAVAYALHNLLGRDEQKAGNGGNPS